MQSKTSAALGSPPPPPTTSWVPRLLSHCPSRHAANGLPGAGTATATGGPGAVLHLVAVLDMWNSLFHHMASGQSATSKDNHDQQLDFTELPSGYSLCLLLNGGCWARKMHPYDNHKRNHSDDHDNCWLNVLHLMPGNAKLARCSCIMG